MRKVKNPKWDEPQQHQNNRHIDWDSVEIGETYLISFGDGKNDYRSHPSNFLMIIRQAARRRDCTVKTRQFADPKRLGDIQFQFVQAEPKTAAKKKTGKRKAK